MLKKLSMRWRLTLLCALLLTVCCVGLTIVLNFSAFRLADQIDAAIITTPATDSAHPEQGEELLQELIPSIPSVETQQAKKFFSVQSILYMLLVIFGGSALTYYVSGKALKPLRVLNGQVKKMTVHSLSESLAVPPAKDELAELTQSFNDMTDKLSDAFLMHTRFSASAAHELRTPLAVLQTKIDVFNKKSAHSNDEYEALISVFQKQVNRLRGLVGNLLDMANMDDAREKSKLSLRDIFEDIKFELSTIAQHKNVSLSLRCDGSTVYGNLDLLYRAFYNLIENAIKYNVDGGIVQIDVTQTAREHVQILIQDSGIGIPDEMKKHIFEPFYRVDQSRSREMGGAGLGLSIVESIIHKHGGTITVLDGEKSGSCFRIVL